MSSDITVVVCTTDATPKKQRSRAIRSVLAQTLQPARFSVEYDDGHPDRAAARNRALASITTSWCVFLDDADRLLSRHLELLAACAEQTAADVVYSIPRVPDAPGHRDPAGRHGMPFDAAELRRRNYIDTPCLVRTRLLQIAGGFRCSTASGQGDWRTWLRLVNAGARFVHLPDVTFVRGSVAPDGRRESAVPRPLSVFGPEPIWLSREATR